MSNSSINAKIGVTTNRIYKEEKDDPLSEYEILGKIGKGSFGKVMHIKSKESKKHYAVKIISKKNIDPQELEKVNREIDIVSSLSHPNIIEVKEVIESSSKFYIIMEYCKNGELLDYIIKREKLEEIEASIFFYQIINAVDYLHNKKIIHRDIKPENILLTENNNIKIIDFGLSNYVDKTNGFLNTPCGSPYYAPPEMILNQVYSGYCTDIWSCGVLLYAMVFGFLPFKKADKYSNIYKQVVEGNFDIPKNVSNSLRNLIRQMLSVKPETRISMDNIKKNPFYLKGSFYYYIEYGSYISPPNNKGNFRNSDKKFISNKNKKCIFNRTSDTFLDHFKDKYSEREKYLSPDKFKRKNTVNSNRNKIPVISCWKNQFKSSTKNNGIKKYKIMINNKTISITNEKYQSVLSTPKYKCFISNNNNNNDKKARYSYVSDTKLNSQNKETPVVSNTIKHEKTPVHIINMNFQNSNNVSTTDNPNFYKTNPNSLIRHNFKIIKLKMSLNKTGKKDNTINISNMKSKYVSKKISSDCILDENSTQKKSRVFENQMTRKSNDASLPKKKSQMKKNYTKNPRLMNYDKPSSRKVSIRSRIFLLENRKQNLF